MKRLLLFTFLAYYALGILWLPESDFAVLPDLPAMYRHCKALEDKDMTPWDFVKDHLINVDGFFDSHTNGDHQKPHTPITFHQKPQQTVVLLPQLKLMITAISIFSQHSPIPYIIKYHFYFIPFIFHPPAP